ncbi:MAG: D-alanyl-D-alanine carboxypeptidase/D-alanyl-D-alanine-endopeptidase, partial [Sphingobacteriales bacterium]|nr:D-alanyl-D-alanine carboxypeptidase/D-alanyl-D-alanine-endopeptidase [Sphingobacteriales bacterium]
LSGYLITKKNKLLIFSFQAGNFQGGATPVRLAFERFIKYLRNNY